VTIDGPGGQYDIHEARINLSCIVGRVEQGEEIIITRAGTPVAKVVPVSTRVKRTRRGSLAGRLVLDDGWDAPEVSDAIAREFGLPAR
jgi:prevent-host-death family protein